MILGRVSEALEATIPITIRRPGGPAEILPAIVDTGFDFWLTLAPETVDRLGLPHVGPGKGILADGSAASFGIFAAELVWDGESRLVEVAAISGAPLVGMSLLEGYELSIEVASGGLVSISRLTGA